MTPCTCFLCVNGKTEPRSVGQCHGYDGTNPCCRAAILDDLLCHVHAREQSDAVRSLCRDAAKHSAQAPRAFGGCVCGGGRGTHRADCTETRLVALERVAHKPQPVLTRGELAALLREAMTGTAEHTLTRLLNALEAP